MIEKIVFCLMMKLMRMYRSCYC